MPPQIENVQVRAGAELVVDACRSLCKREPLMGLGAFANFWD